MKTVMINDCAYVGEVLLKYMPSSIDRQHIKRGRGFWNKTFGLAYRILRAKGDVYHAHYLLQDCYIASRLHKRPLIGHAHGSDLRESLAHPVWGRIVRHDLKSCDKVLVSTPDVLAVAKSFRHDVEYLPNPVDKELFYPKPLTAHDGRRRVLVASDCSWRVKGTDTAVRALSQIRDEVDVSIIGYGVDFEKTVALASQLKLKLNVLPKVPHDKLNEYYWASDVVIDRFQLGSLGLASLEAIACGRPVVTYVSREYEEYKEFPMKDVRKEDEIVAAVREADVGLWRKEHAYFTAKHGLDDIVDRIVKLYEELAAK